MNNLQHYYWTDSRIVLGYLRNDSKRFKIFVANRVQEIHDFSSPSQWRHVAGHNNPADLASRGMDSGKLLDCALWFRGPSFLHQEHPILGDGEFAAVDQSDQELRTVIVNATNVNNDLDVFNFGFFSSWTSLVRGVARAKLLATLFKKHVSIKGRLRSGGGKSALEPLRVSNISSAETLITKAIQSSYFSEEIEALKSKLGLTKANELRRLDCFLDGVGLLRVGGRLKSTDLYSVFKHPIVLPSWRTFLHSSF